jgi:hypothetical protein
MHHATVGRVSNEEQLQYREIRSAGNSEI